MDLKPVKFINYQKKNSIVVITLNRPDRLNALGNEVVKELEEALNEFQCDAETRVAILTGSGRSFSVGADVKEGARRHTRLGVESDRVNCIMRKVEKPVIAAINGFALGSGLWALVLNCDIRIASLSATFGMPEIALAIPARPEPFLAQNIPLCAALELIISDDRITAQRAYDIGLVNRIVPDEELLPTAMKIAEKIASLSPWAINSIRRAGMEAIKLSEETWQLNKRKQKVIAELSESEEHREALKAFANNRKRQKSY